MINSFQNLENKLVESYVKKHYNKNDENYDDNENALKNCVSISRKLENSLINFNKDEIRKYFNDYNKNLKDIKYNRMILNKNFHECILFIIKNLIEYFTNIINEIQNEIELNNYSLNNDN